jgi:hypothetical protein
MASQPTNHNLFSTGLTDLNSGAISRERVRRPYSPSRLPRWRTISLDITAERASAGEITVHAWQLPVTESSRSRRNTGGQHDRHPEIRTA